MLQNLKFTGQSKYDEDYNKIKNVEKVNFDFFACKKAT